MTPTAVTFVDDKMLPLAQEQADNFRSFGVPHEIVHLTDIKDYGTDLWLKLLDLTIEKIKQHGKILRLDAEIRIHKDLPSSWLEADNVLFQPWPLQKDPIYVALNTGHMVLSLSGIGFLETLKECILAMIPPDMDTSMPARGESHHIEDEWPSAIAIRLSKIQYLQEQLCHDRRLNANCAVSRGTWIEPNTVLTHPSIHNWDWPGAGLNLVMAEVQHTVFLNHFGPTWEIKKVDLIAKLLKLRNSNENLWKGLGAIEIDKDEYVLEGWQFKPAEGLVKPTSATKYKTLVGFNG